MKDFAFKYEIEDDHLDNCLFLLLLIAAKYPKALKRPYNLKTYISFFSKLDLTESKVLNKNNGLRIFFEHLKKGENFRAADNIKLELNKEFYKRIYFYKHDWRNIILSTIFFILSLFCSISGFFFGKATINHFSISVLLVFLGFLGFGLISIFLFVEFYGELVSSVNLTNNLIDDKVLYLFSQTIPIKIQHNKITFKHLPVSRKVIFEALEQERQAFKNNKIIVIEKHIKEEKLVIEKQIVEVEKPVVVEKVVEIEKENPQVFKEPDITSNEYIESNQKLQHVFEEFPSFKDYYPILCSKVPEEKKRAFIVYDSETQSLKWTGTQEAFLRLFFTLCRNQYGVSEDDLKSISEAFVHKSGQEVDCHTLQVSYNNFRENEKVAKYSKDTRALYEVLEKSL